MGRKRKRGARRRQGQPRDAARGPRPGWRRRLLPGLAGLLLTALLMILGLGMDLLYDLEGKAQDYLSRRRSAPQSREVVVVMIDDNDYRGHFDATSPLRPDTLKRLLLGVSACGPRVIGVDVATSDGQFRGKFRGEDAAALAPIVWASAVFEFVPDREGGPDLPVPHEVLGGDGPRDGDLSALPTLIDDSDGVTRYYQRGVKTVYDTEVSFARAVVEKFNAGLPGGKQEIERRFIRYARGDAGERWKQFPASDFLPPGDSVTCAHREELAGRIVLLGGNYLGSDRHDTPLGEMNGVHVLASVVETELEGGGLIQPGEWTLAPLWLLQGVLMVLVFQRYPLDESPLKNLALGLALVALTSLAGGGLAALQVSPAARTLNPLPYVGYFLPVGLAVLLLQIVDFLNDRRKEWLGETFGPARPASETSRRR